MTNTFVVLGQQFGDEAKGKLVDYLVEKYKDNAVVFRFNGGNNAGHTIKIDNIKYFSHLFPSGSFTPGVKNYLGPGVVINLRGLFDEYNEHISKGINLDNRFFISELCHITFDVHILLDKAHNKNIGTTNKGIGPTYSDIASRKGIRLDMLLGDNWENHLLNLYNFHNYELQESEKDFIISCKEMLMKWCVPQNKIIDEFNNSNNNIIIEGANAFMLDNFHGTYPFVTSSHCSFAGVFTGLGLCPSYLNKRSWEIIGVSKSYITRVGGGVLPTEEFSEIGTKIQEIGGEVGVTTGRNRRCGWIDIPQLIFANNINGITHLNITKLDVLSFLDKINICIKYTDIDNYPSNEEKLKNVKPEYLVIDGWKGFDISKCKTFNDLHPNIINFINIIEKLTNIPIKYINTGSERTQMIVK
jgi:adenylosuccinate synthase